MKGHFGDLRFASEQLQEARHRRHAIDHAFVHADVEDIRSVLDLLAGDVYGVFIFAVLDEPRKFGRTGDIGALTDHDEDASLLGEWLRP